MRMESLDELGTSVIEYFDKLRTSVVVTAKSKQKRPFGYTRWMQCAWLPDLNSYGIFRFFNIFK